jgi:hypothetical protein
MASVPHSKVSIGSTGGAGPFDPRTGSGYGSIDPSYHTHRGMGDGYPYDNTDEQEEFNDEIEEMSEEWSEETERAIHKKADGPHDFDNAGFGHDDPYHFVDAASKLTEISVGSGIAPIPGLNKRRRSPVGGTKAGTARSDGSSTMPKFRPRSDIWAGKSTYAYLHNEESADNYIEDSGIDSDVFDPNNHELYLTESKLRRLIRGIIYKLL